MADQNEIVEDAPAAPGADVEMGENEGTEAEGSHANSRELPFAEEGLEDPAAPRVSFVQYLSTPIVTLLLGSGDNETVLTAHQGLLTQSPFFAEQCNDFTDDGSVCD
jgi:hypothetical protein